MTEYLISTRELARRLCVSHRTVRTWARDGRIPVVRIARNRLRFDWRQVLESIRAAAPFVATREGSDAS
jgi:excisionase family DNA binding protein